MCDQGERANINCPRPILTLGTGVCWFQTSRVSPHREDIFLITVAIYLPEGFYDIKSAFLKFLFSDLHQFQNCTWDDFGGAHVDNDKS